MTRPGTATTPRYSIVIPTIGRDNLTTLIELLAADPDLAADAVVVVDDRPVTAAGSLPLSAATGLPLRIVASGGVGPAAARNTGWQSAPNDWIVFLDDDVQIEPGWARALHDDLGRAGAEVGGCQGRLRVPRPDRRPTDDERRTIGLESAQWITADMAYRWRALMTVGGFDPRFTRAYREDADLALRVTDAGYPIVSGERKVVHPIAPGGFWRSVSVQRGNADDVLMRSKHGSDWRSRCQAGPTRITKHLATVCAAAACAAALVAGRHRIATIAAAAWTILTGEFVWTRIRRGPRTAHELASMASTSAVIPFAAVAFRLRGARKHLRQNKSRPGAVLFDRDDTLIVDVPYLSDAELVEPMPGAIGAVAVLRRAGVATGVVTNQSGIGRGLVSAEQLAAVHARVDALLGPFDTWQFCPHVPDDGCGCRKPMPGLIERAAAELGVPATTCVVIGDIGADVAAAEAAGASAVLVPTPRTRAVEVTDARNRSAVRANLIEAIETICGDCR